MIVSQSFRAEFLWVSRDATPAKRTNNQSNNISKRTRHMLDPWQKCFYVLSFNTQHKREVSGNTISDSMFMKLKTGTLRQEADPWRKLPHRAVCGWTLSLYWLWSSSTESYPQSAPICSVLECLIRLPCHTAIATH